MEKLLGDVRYALRQLRRSPGFALTAVLTLALGIGVNVVAFGVLRGLLFRPGNFAEPERVMALERPLGGEIAINFSYPRYRDLRDRNTTLSGLVLSRIAAVGMQIGDASHAVWGYEASGNYFDVLGVKPALGRFFHAGDEHGAGSSPYLVLSYDCWRGRFDADPAIVGKVVRLNKQPYTVLGVAPKAFYGTEKFLAPEFWLPVANESEIEGFNWLEERGDNNAWVVGRLKPGVTVAQATADLNRVAAELGREHPKDDEGFKIRLAQPGFLGDMLGGPLRAFLAGVMALSALVLLATCANLGSLFAARTADRSREIALRMAIGSTRWRVVRQLMTESVVTALLGGVIASAVAAVLLRAIMQWRYPTEIPGHLMVSEDGWGFAFALLLAVVAGVVFAVIPARQIAQADPNDALRGGRNSAGAGGWTLRDVLLLLQVALCCVLVTASLVSLRGMQNALHMPFGFQPDHVARVRFDLQLAGYKDEDTARFQREVRDSVAALPGVTSAAYANTTPLALDQSNNSVYREGTTDFRPSNIAFDAGNYKISPGYFATAGTKLLYGRDFLWTDGAKAPRVAVINQTFARKLFGSDASAVGKHFLTWDGKRQHEVIGVVEDGKYQTLTEAATPAMFNSTLQEGNPSTVLIARTDGDAGALASQIAALVKRKDGSVPISLAQTWTTDLGTVLFPARAATAALSVLGALAMMLAVTGIFGMASYAVSKRMRELSIRVALGASGRQVLRAALGRMAVLLGVGSAAGLLLGAGATRLLASIVYHATAADPLVLAGVAVTMGLVGALSVVLPVRRALLADPATLLREE